MYNITRDDFVTLYKTPWSPRRAEACSRAQGRRRDIEEERRGDETRKAHIEGKLWCSATTAGEAPAHTGSQFCPSLSFPTKRREGLYSRRLAKCVVVKARRGCMNSTRGNLPPATIIPNASFRLSNLTARFSGSYVVTLLNWTPVFEGCGIRLVPSYESGC
jgi:hypothetical protein